MEQTWVRSHVRWMIRRDLPEVMAIENASFAHPCTQDELLLWLRRRTCIGMVAEVGPRIVGFMVYELSEREITVLDFAVDPQWRRRRIGTQMLAKLECKLAAHRRNRIVSRVGESELAAQLFFRSREFRAVGVERGYFDDGQDAYVMQYCPFTLAAMALMED